MFNTIEKRISIDRFQRVVSIHNDTENVWIDVVLASTLTDMKDYKAFDVELALVQFNFSQL